MEVEVNACGDGPEPKRLLVGSVYNVDDVTASTRGIQVRTSLHMGADMC